MLAYAYTIDELPVDLTGTVRAIAAPLGAHLYSPYWSSPGGSHCAPPGERTYTSGTNIILAILPATRALP